MNGYINLGRRAGHQLAMASFQVVSLAFLLFSAISTLGFPNEAPSPAPVTEDSNEECRPKPPEPGKPREECCALPGSGPPSDDKRKLMKECVEMLKDDFPPPPPPPPGHAPPPPPEGDKPKPPPPPPHHHHPPPPPGHIECIEECEFNKTGHLTTDLKLNSEEIMKTFLEEYGKDEVWKPIVEQAVQTCVTSATEDVKEDTKCKSGAHQFMKCFRKQLFLNCPSNVWKSSEACNAEKELVIKCKDYMPPPPPPPPPSD